MRLRNMMRRMAAIIAAGWVAGLVLGGPSALAQPDDPGVPGDASGAPPVTHVDLSVSTAGDPLPHPTSPASPVMSTPAGQNQLPFAGRAPFPPPSFNPVDGAIVGVAKPIIIDFAVPIADRAQAQQAIRITSTPAVPGKFYWMSDSQVRWRPIEFWPAGTTVNIDAAGTKSSFQVGESLVATVDNHTHEMQIVRNGELVKTFPVSLGKPGWETPNGTYYTLEKFADIVMDSSTFGLRVDSPEGYRLEVQDAVRISNDGIFVHGAPWSQDAQGYENVSHGCINLSPTNAQWFFDNFGSGDPVVVKNSIGSYTNNDGAQDWQI